MTDTNRTVLTLGSDLAELSRLAGETDAFCDRQGVPDAARMALQLALEEIVTNIVSHGGAEAAPIEVALVVEPAFEKQRQALLRGVTDAQSTN